MARSHASPDGLVAAPVCQSTGMAPEPFLTDILRIPVRLEVIFRPWGLRGNEIRSQPAR
jgi:hypothetical protein